MDEIAAALELMRMRRRWSCGPRRLVWACGVGLSEHRLRCTVLYHGRAFVSFLLLVLRFRVCTAILINGHGWLGDLRDTNPTDATPHHPRPSASVSHKTHHNTAAATDGAAVAAALASGAALVRPRPRRRHARPRRTRRAGRGGDGAVDTSTGAGWAIVCCGVSGVRSFPLTRLDGGRPTPCGG